MPVRIGGRGGGGRVTAEVYTPAVALFEHPEDATATFLADVGNTEGLTVTLREPLEYGQDTSQWSIIGEQRYQGTPDVPAENPSISGDTYATGTTSGFLGAFTTANRPDISTLTANASIYDTTIGRFLWSSGVADWALIGNLGQLDIYGLGPLLNFTSVSAGLQANAVEFADSDAVEAYLGENIDTWLNLSSNIGGYTDADEDLLWFDLSDGNIKTLGTVTPAIAATAASVDFPTSATGGIRVIAGVTGPGGNSWTITVSAGNATLIIPTANDYDLSVADGATAANILNAINANADLSAEYYGTETGGTVIRSGSTLILPQTTQSFSGGADAIYYVAAVLGIEDDPPHVVVDPENQRITAYYNIAAGGRLTEADTLGDLKGAFDTAADGLSSEYVGGGATTDVMTRPFATSDQFSQADLRGLQLMLLEPLAGGTAGNNFGLVSRGRFPGGAEVSEVQSHVLIYSRSDRGGGVRIAIDADIQGLNEHSVPVDISSGALGNDWRFTAVSASGGLADTITVDTVNRIITYYAGINVGDVEANHIRTACNRGGTGCSARSFGTYFGGAHVFDGSLARVNTLPQQFHGGRDYHAATANPEPITVTEGPTHAHTRLYTAVDGGILLSVIDPEYDGGNGFTFDSSEGDPLRVSVFPMHRRVALTIPSAGSLASEILTILNANDALEATYFGTEDGTTNVMHDRFGRHELLGGLDATEVEIQYAPVASGGIANPDTMGSVKTAWDDRAAGRISFYYGGADAATIASRLVPWEHEFENGVTTTINLSGFGLGPEQNEFTGADRAAAETARDNYAAANPTWVEAYRGQLNVWIALRWGTAPGTMVGQTLRANASNPPVAADWTDQNIALRGEMGTQGSQGSYDIEIFQNAATAPGTPTGGSVVVATGAVTPPAGWLTTESQPPAGQDTYRSRARINPSTQSGTVTPTWRAPVDIRAEVSDADIDARIAPPARANNPTGTFDDARIPDLDAAKVATGTLDDARIPDGITRDTEDIDASRVTGTLDDANIPAGITRDTEDIDASRLTGTIADARIPTGITRDTEDIAATRLTGTIDDARIPAAITRDAEVKAFALTGGRGVRVGDMDSESAADDSVPTADGSGGVVWEAQQGGGTPPVLSHIRYAAIRTADAMFTAADFTAAEATQSQTNTIDTPDTTDDAFLAFAIPNDVNDLSDIRQEGGTFSYFASFTLSATLITLDSEDHKVYISNFAIASALIGGNWVLTPSP